MNVLETHIESGKSFKDTYGQFNYGLCYNDSLLKLTRDANGNLIQPDVRIQNDVETPVKSTVFGQFNNKDQLHGVGRIACTGTEYDLH